MISKLQDLLNLIGVENTNFYGEESFVRLRELAQKAHLLDWKIPIISVTGTNGKGSTVCSLAKIYQEAGYRVGVFTSPHLHQVNERISINDQLISDEDFIASIEFVRHIDKQFELSFFETITLAALYYFKGSNIDLLVLEVGLGGRLDAINILDADLVIMTSVDLDHQHILGADINAIAKEKAGLLRPQAKFIFADRSCPDNIFSLVDKLELDFWCLGHNYEIKQNEASWSFDCLGQSFVFSCFPKVHIQAMASAVLASQLLQAELPVTTQAWQRANQLAIIPGRLERYPGQPDIILDVAHNPHAVKCLYDYLSKQKISGKLHIVFSVLTDKDGAQIVKIINNLSPLWYTCLLSSERSHTEKSLESPIRLVLRSCFRP
jgi:dihydrofolate synthase/folylpolyglutamate synthase